MLLKKTEELLFFLSILFITTQLGKHFWPDFSYIFSLKIDYLSPVVYFWDLLTLALIFNWLLKKPHINQKALSVFLIFILTGLISLFNAQNIGAGLVRLEQFICAGLLGLYLSGKKFNDYKESLRKGFVLTVIFQSFLAIGQFISGRSLGLWFIGERDFNISTPAITKFNWRGVIFLRPYGTFPHPNVLAGFICVLLPITSYLNRNFNKIAILIGSISVMLSFSKTALLVLVAYSASQLMKNFIKFLPVFILLLLMFISQFNSALKFDQLSFTRREDLNVSAMESFWSSPILGVGLNNFISVQAKAGLLAGPGRFLQPVHNIFLLQLSETGILGLLGLLGLLGYPIYRLLRERSLKISKILLLSWVSIFFLGMFDHYFLTLPQGQRLLFLIWGLSLSEKY